MHVIFERLKRPNYFDGRLLSAADLRAEQDYCRNKIARHNRLLHGSGVVSGLQIQAKPAVLHVSPGLAFDCVGNEIVLDSEQIVPLPRGRASPQFLVVHYAETPVDFVPTTGGNAEAGSIEESFSLSYEPADPFVKHARRGRASSKLNSKLRTTCGRAHGVTLAKLVLRAGRWRIERPTRPR
jgi:hypothetical protein